MGVGLKWPRQGLLVYCCEGFCFFWLRGGHLFCGSGEIKVVVRTQGGFGAQISIRSLSVRLESFRAWETAMGERLSREALLRGFRVSVFGWRVTVFFAAVGISGLSSVPGGFPGF